MRNKTPFLALPLAIAALAGCGGSDETNDTTEASTNTTEATTTEATTTEAGTAETTAAPAPASGGTAVDMKGLQFMPDAIEVSAGDSVTFANLEVAEHTATADDKSFATKVLKEGESEDVKFDSPGTFSYFCEIHPFMKGAVTVK